MLGCVGRKKMKGQDNISLSTGNMHCKSSLRTLLSVKEAVKRYGDGGQSSEKDQAMKRNQPT
jgi:hypothetical protein